MLLVLEAFFLLGSQDSADGPPLEAEKGCNELATRRFLLVNRTADGAPPMFLKRAVGLKLRLTSCAVFFAVVFPPTRPPGEAVRVGQVFSALVNFYDFVEF